MPQETKYSSSKLAVSFTFLKSNILRFKFILDVHVLIHSKNENQTKLNIKRQGEKPQVLCKHSQAQGNT